MIPKVQATKEKTNCYPQNLKLFLFKEHYRGRENSQNVRKFLQNIVRDLCLEYVNTTAQ